MATIKIAIAYFFKFLFPTYNSQLTKIRHNGRFGQNDTLSLTGFPRIFLEIFPTMGKTGYTWYSHLYNLTKGKGGISQKKHTHEKILIDKLTCKWIIKSKKKKTCWNECNIKNAVLKVNAIYDIVLDQQQNYWFTEIEIF